MQYVITQNGVPIGVGKGVSAKFPIMKSHVGFMIGKKGGNVKRIRDKYHVQILIQDEKTDDPWFLVRALFQKNLDAACSELAMLGNRFPSQSTSMRCLRRRLTRSARLRPRSWWLQEHAGALIGPKGSNVKQVAKDCGAFIYIQQPTAATNGHPWFQIKGLYVKNIEAAYATLAKKVMELSNQQAEVVEGPTPE